MIEHTQGRPLRNECDMAKFVQNGRCTPGQDWLCDASAKKSAKAKRVRR
jgi:hypothetical protein